MNFIIICKNDAILSFQYVIKIMAYHINNTIDGAALYEHFVHWDCAQAFQCVHGPLMC